MLYLDKPIGPIRGLMCYADHADPDLFYYVPERPRLARNDGVPEFIFLKYRRDITDNPDFDEATKQSLGGGFLAFTVDLGVSDEELKEIKRELGRFAEGEVKLTPIQFRKGSVRLSISKDTAEAEGAPPDQPKGFSFFEEVYGTSKPSLFGFNRATFALVLSQEAATLFEAALRSGVSPIGVIYDLEFLGLRPAFNVRISANYHSVYRHLEAQFGARGQIYAVSLGVDIGVAFQQLRDQGVIKVEVLNFTDEEDLRKQADEAFNWFKTELLKEFFKPSLEPPSFMRQQAGGGLLGQLTNLLGPLIRTQSGSPTPQRGAPTTAAPTAAPAPTAQPSGVQSTSAANTAASGTPGSATGGAAGGTSPAPFQVAFSLKFFEQVEDKERIFEYSMQAAVARDAAPQGLFSTVVEGLDLNKAIIPVNLDDKFFTRLVSTVSVGGDLAKAGVNVMAVNLEYPAVRKPSEQPAHVDGFIFKPDQLDPHTFQTWLNAKKDRSYRYQLDVHFNPDSPFVGKETHVRSDWVVTGARQLTVDPLDEVALLDVTVSPGNLKAEQVSQVQVELFYEDPANDFDVHKTLLVKPGDAVQRWGLRLSNPELNTYRYRLQYFLTDGVRYQAGWQTTDDPALIVNEPFEGTLKVRLTPLLDPAQLVEAVVNLGYDEAETGYARQSQTVFSGGQPLASQTVSIPTLAKEPASFTYDLTIVRADGSVFAPGPVHVPLGETQPVIVVSDGEGRTARIKVKLLNTDLTSSDLAAVKVLVVGPGDNPDSAEALFLPNQTADQTLTLVQPDGGGAFKYTYTVTGFSRIGLSVPGQTGQETSPTLLVGLPVS